MNDTIEINVTINGETSTKTISIQEWVDTNDMDTKPCDSIVSELLWGNEYYYTTYLSEYLIEN